MACNWLSEGEDDTEPHDVTRQPAVIARHLASDDDPVFDFLRNFAPLLLSRRGCGILTPSAPFRAS